MKRFITITMISLLILSAFLFSACGGGSSDSAETSDSAQTSDSTQTEETADVPEGVAGQLYIYESCIFEVDGEAQEFQEDASQSLLFKDDGTFEYTFTNENGDLTTATGTYSENGESIQLKFDEQFAEQLGVEGSDLIENGDTLTEVVDKDIDGTGHIHREVKYTRSTSVSE